MYALPVDNSCNALLHVSKKKLSVSQLAAPEHRQGCEIALFCVLRLNLIILRPKPHARYYILHRSVTFHISLQVIKYVAWQLSSEHFCANLKVWVLSLPLLRKLSHFNKKRTSAWNARFVKNAINCKNCVWKSLEKADWFSSQHRTMLLPSSW